MPELVTDNALSRAIAQVAGDVEKVLGYLLPADDGPEKRLFEAMRYTALGGGKRLRPFLVVTSGQMFGVARAAALRVAAAVECVHSYSLIHDDLPCMDDDDLRRGRPANHIAFDEATAILAGDALLTRAFGILAEEATHGDPRVRCELVHALAEAAGDRGMVGGQIIDLMAENETLDASAITRLQQMKTGAIISFSAEAGAIMGRAGAEMRHALHAYAHDLGLAFQIIDDLLDIDGDPVQTGKSSGKDAAAGKATLVSVMGPERARVQAEILARQAVIHLDVFAEEADLLRQLADFVINRRK